MVKMKPRLIDANRLLKYVDDHQMISSHLIYNSPTVEAEPVRPAHWINITNAESVDYEFACSLCGYTNFLDVVNAFHYCPNCGAKMEKRKKE